MRVIRNIEGVKEGEQEEGEGGEKWVGERGKGRKGPEYRKSMVPRPKGHVPSFPDTKGCLVLICSLEGGFPFVVCEMLVFH